MRSLFFSMAAVSILAMVTACGGSGSSTSLWPASTTTPGVYYMHSVALKSTGVGYAWGYNGFGQLGNGNSANSLVPVAIAGVSGMTQLATGGNHTLAFGFSNLSSGVRAWGNNGYGQLGNNSTTFTASYVPVRVLIDTNNTPLRNVTAAAAGGSHNLAITTDAKVWAWGYNGWGQLGSSTGTLAYSLYAVPVLDQALGTQLVAQQVWAGGGHSMALMADGTARSWGLNAAGQLGNGDTTLANQPFPVPVKDAAGTGTLSNVIALSAGGSHSLALVSVGGTNSVWSWGYNGFGQLGNNSLIQGTLPVQVLNGSVSPAVPLTGIVQVSAGLDHSLALDNSGVIWAWGRNFYGQLGNGTFVDQSTAVKVTGFPAGTVITRVIADGDHSLAVDSTGKIWSWGFNAFGQLGVNTVNNSAVPLVVIGFP